MLRLTLILSLLATVAHAGQVPHMTGPGYVSVADLNAMCERADKDPELSGYCHGYLAGVADTLNDLHASRYGGPCWGGSADQDKLKGFFQFLASSKPDLGNTIAASFVGIAIQAVSGSQCKRLRVLYEPVK